MKACGVGGWTGRALFGLLLVGLTAPPAYGQATSQDFVTWLNSTVDHIVATRLEQTSSSHQVEAPSALPSSTSLVDNASVSDLIGLALAPPTFPRADAGQAEATSQAFTISPYAILAALTGRDPNDPYFYQDESAWRLLGITVGTESVDDGAGMEERALVVGLKLKVWDRRNVEPDPDALGAIREQVSLSGAAVARMTTAIQDRLAFLSSIDITDAEAFVEFQNGFQQGANFSSLLSSLTDDQRKELTDIIEAEIEPLLALNQASRALVASLRGEPQLSLAFSGRMSQSGRDTYRIGVAFDKDLATGVAWTLNGSLEIQESFGLVEEDYGATFATQLSFSLADPSLTEAPGARLTLAAEGSFMQDADSQARLQAKLLLPLTAGLEFPISLTWANRTDLIDEEDVYGQIGVTMNTAWLLSALDG